MKTKIRKTWGAFALTEDEERMLMQKGRERGTNNTKDICKTHKESYYFCLKLQITHIISLIYAFVKRNEITKSTGKLWVRWDSQT